MQNEEKKCAKQNAKDMICGCCSYFCLFMTKNSFKSVNFQIKFELSCFVALCMLNWHIDRHLMPSFSIQTTSDQSQQWIKFDSRTTANDNIKNVYQYNMDHKCKSLHIIMMVCWMLYFCVCIEIESECVRCVSVCVCVTQQHVEAHVFAPASKYNTHTDTHKHFSRTICDVYTLRYLLTF